MTTVVDVSVVGLDDEVTIHRDELGIPHIQASTARDAFVAQGFVQAEDRLGQLEYDRRRAYGQWAEVAGRGALGFDIFVRRCGLRDAARREYEGLPPDAREPLIAFAAGVNARIEGGMAMPPDLRAMGVTPEAWSPWDCCAVFLVRHVVFANWQRKLWRGRLAVVLGPETVARLEGNAASDTPLIVPPGEWWRAAVHDPRQLAPVANATGMLVESANGSNAWAVHGSRTASGQPLLAGDPHRLVEVPGVYYQCRLACPEFDAVGLAFVGLPGFPHFGQTDRIAWCVTNANGDYQDLYVERFRDDGSLRYEAAGAWLEPERRTETVEVHDSDAVSVECLETRHGPVVFGDPASGHAVALRSTALVEPSAGLSVLEPMLRAANVDELDDVMRSWVDPVNNFVSADVDGNIGYRTVGRVPVRSPANAWGPVPGWTDEYEWSGVVSHDELPRTKNPAGGLIVTANQRIVGDAYPHHLGLDYARPDRARRLHDRLDDAVDVTVEDMALVHRDRRSLPADVWVEHIAAIDGRDEWERDSIGALRAWDRAMDADSIGAAVYLAVRDAAGRIIAHDPRLAALRAPLEGEPSATFLPLELRLWPLLTELLAVDDRTLLGDEQTWTELLAGAVTNGVGVLRTLLGDDVGAWRWGALHSCAPSHPLSAVRPDVAIELDPAPIEMGGDSDTVFNAAHPAGFGFGVTGASVARYVFDLGDRRNSRWVVPLGASGDRGSEHFADQQRAWAAGELLRAWASWNDLAAIGSDSTRLSSGAR
ncbi:MAG: penicillin acylase family protein [Acidimicrobiia bacterium]